MFPCIDFPWLLSVQHLSHSIFEAVLFLFLCILCVPILYLPLSEIDLKIKSMESIVVTLYIL